MIKMHCDFCGEVKECVHTHYGSTNYTRIICKDCIDAINKEEESTGGTKVLNDDGSFFKLEV